ncbi:galectin-5-like [Mercenaria mercenaria]|uniref:galectin-5-like n=1 Tax=Mercenaria mercenaria TaxID=6596 RepID=UPI00234F5DB5|nr:galectin-5-like [Mercenaria mercenaria]
MALVHVPYPGENKCQGLCGQKIYNPSVPVRHGLGCIYPGKMIFISGIPDSKSPRFSINFKSHKGEVRGNAFHFDVRFEYKGSKDTIVRNARNKGQWGSEERSPSKPFPFKRNEFFEMVVLVEESCYKVAVNDRHLLEFNHRLSLEEVDTLVIRGDVRICMVRIQG